jgi:hypothetical protein
MLVRPLLLLTMALVAIAFAATPALAGDDDGDPTTPPADTQPAPGTPAPTPTPTTPGTTAPNGSAKVHSSPGCTTTKKAKATVSGTGIAKVTFFVGSKKVKTDTTADSNGDYTASMSCAKLSTGTHSAKAVVSFESGVSPTSKTLRFHVIRASAVSPKFTG